MHRQGRAMDRWDLIEAFVRTAEAGSLSRAAKSLGMTQPSVSKRLERLEQLLGVRLLDRSTRGIRLTGAGAHYLDVVRRLRAELDEAEAALSAERRGLSGLLRLSFPVALGETWLTRLALRFHARHPATVLEVGITDRVVDLVEDGVDVAVRLGRITTQSVVARPLGSYRSCLVASPAWLAAHEGGPRTVDALGAVPYFSSQVPGKEEAFTLPDGQVRVLRPQNPVHLINARAALTAALEGAGVTRASVWSVEAHLARGELALVLPEVQLPMTTVQAVYLPSRYVLERVRQFVAMLVEELPRLPGWVAAEGTPSTR